MKVPLLDLKAQFKILGTLALPGSPELTLEQQPYVAAKVQEFNA